MIKINLLPREERRRHAPINTKLLLAGLAGVVALLAMGYGWFWLNGAMIGDKIKMIIICVKPLQLTA